MSSNTVPIPPPQHDNRAHNRKEKSLGLLCSTFLASYNRDDVDTIDIDHVTTQLGVAKRRVYDIFNIFKSVGIVKKKGKNEYTWKGFAAIPSALEKLKEEGLREKSQGNADVEVCAENRREISLGQLTQCFIKLFVCSDVQMISRDDSLKLLLGDVKKSRRLYDIANALSSLNLIEKTHSKDRTPAYRWLGYKPTSKIETTSSLVEKVNEPIKCLSKEDLTSNSVKRNNNDSDDMVTIQQLQNQTNLRSLPSDTENSSCMDHDSMESSKNFTVGPLAPIKVLKVGNSRINKVRRNYDVDNLASIHRPQYYNRALKDLFGHYQDAWKTWYSEVSEQKHDHQNL